MASESGDKRVFVLGNPDKPGVKAALDHVCEFVAARCTLVGQGLGHDASEALTHNADFVVVLGGDGTILAVCRSLGHTQVPLIGVNFGKLGFLAEFTVAELEAHFDDIIANGDLISERMILECRIERSGTVRFESLAVNDCVVVAGAPFRMIELEVKINNVHLTTMPGDGMIVCTPVGSTAYNLAAGGPIMQGAVMGIALTPLSPHSLTHRPLVVEHMARIEIGISQANEGTTLLVDGQINAALKADDRVLIEQSDSKLELVRNPSHPKWHGLVTKLRWGQSPNYE